MFCGCRSRAPGASAQLQGTNAALASCDMGCEVCGYNWYVKHQPSTGSPYWNKHCDCCLGTDAQQSACKQMCLKQWPVTLFDGLNYSGAAVGIDAVGTYNFCQGTLPKNDTIQSVKVLPGWKVTLIMHCAGEKPNPDLVLLGNSTTLGPMSKQTSVVKVEKVPVVLFDGVDYTGDAVAITGPGTFDYCKQTLTKNDTIQSVYVEPGWKVTLIKHCAGEKPNPMIELFASRSNLGDMNKQTSIVVVEKANWRCITPKKFVPVSMNAVGDAECLSSDGKNCSWTNSEAECVQAVKSLSGASIVPLVCGDAHKAVYGSTGYEAGHWCQAAKDGK